MAIYIKGMKMPKNCEECFLVGSCTGKHWEITKDDIGYKGEYVIDNCPLTEVSEPHGRLIDADALYTKATELWDTSDSEDFEKGIFKLILNAPTVSAELTLQTPQTYGKSIKPSNAEVVEDLISRADAIEAVVSWTVEDRPTEEMPTDLVDRINALPSAEADMSEYADRLWKIAYERGKREASAEAVQGEWIMVKGSNGKDYHKCSKCLHTQEITGVKNYCAVCGARMKGGADE